MSEVQQLYQLQEIDTELQEKKRRLAEVLNAQKETDELLAARERVTATEGELHIWQTKQRDLNLQLESLNGKAKRSEDRLYSGTVSNPKELTDLQNEIASPSAGVVRTLHVENGQAVAAGEVLVTLAALDG